MVFSLGLDLGTSSDASTFRAAAKAKQGCAELHVCASPHVLFASFLVQPCFDTRCFWVLVSKGFGTCFCRAMPAQKRKLSGRNRGRQAQKTCPCCGGLRSLARCVMPAAKELRAFRKAFPKGPGAFRRKKAKADGPKSGKYKTAATAAYSGKVTGPRLRRNVRPLSEVQWQEKLQDPHFALQALRDVGFLRKNLRCSFCDHKHLKPPTLFCIHLA